MNDVSCLLAGLTRLLFPFLLLVIWRRKTGALLYPALVAFLVTVPVFIVAGGIRSGFSQDDLVLFHLQTGLLFGIFEEGGKYLALRYALESYDSRENAVTYGIGHGIWEEIGAGLICFGLIGTGNAAPDILPVNLFFALFGTADVIALTEESMKDALSNTVSNVLTIPDTLPIFAPSRGVVPLQIFAYYVALQRGCDIDKPRNLATSVTVE